jgi:P27 family predicted phage terminase small subunit
MGDVVNLEGDRNNGKSYRAKQVPEFDRAVPDMPEWLTDYAVEEWERITPALARVGILSAVDMGLLAAYCEAVSTLRAATEDIAERGQLVPSAREGALVKNPSVAIQRDATTTIRALGKQLGLEPGRRKRSPGQVAGQSDNPIVAEFSEYLS